ncbi:unnamed protein product [Mytilus coruscus]|uniref:Ig-like domain-containing protein n=1 Tax=Mytilus coruscus TaxID=42192 RepID=A0A6J8EV27_MYTCO|nr:unnamed protein product [Mytilus coruscus]
MHDLIEEINEGETKKLCCYVDGNPTPTSTKWLNGSQEILVTHNVAKTCYTIKNVTRYDEGNYTCIAYNAFGNGSITTVLQFKCNRRAVVENIDIALASAGHSSTSSDNNRNASVYLDDGYEHPYNTLLANNLAEDEHVYLTQQKTSNNANSTPFENSACGCSFEFTEQDSLPDQTKTHCYAKDCEDDNESVL